MHIETKIRAVIDTWLGDEFDDNATKEEIDALVEQHIEEYCNEHEIEEADVKIIDQGVTK